MSKKIEKHQKKIIYLIITCVFFVSIAYSFSFKIKPIVDAATYDNIAVNIAKGDGYPNEAIGRPGPGYEYFLAGIYLLFGHSYKAVWIIQSLLLSMTALFGFYITKIILGNEFHPAIGIGAVILIGLSPDFITIASLLMTETLTIFLLTGSILSALLYVKKNNNNYLALAMVGMGITSLVRGNMIIAILPVVGFLIYKKQWKRLIMSLIILGIVLTPWTVHNYRAFGKILPFNASPGLLYSGNHPGATGELITTFPLPQEIHEGMNQIEFDTALGKAGKRYILENPVEFLKLSMLRISIYFSAARPLAFWPHLTSFAKSVTIATSSLYAFIIFIGGLTGMVLSLRNPKNKEKKVMLIALAAMLPLAIAPLVIETRYRMPIYPILSTFTAFAIYYFITRKEELRKLIKPTIIVAGLIFANTAFDVIRNFDRILDRL
ncbi:MAG: hypothetical protein COU08_02435 [Candidatus Harrisonbacteria bacterium CG10_big_fil_rev_8_21_14_0_10_42_17]|uniref:Glycosyltransferase RgtA/B/C/D-like domain-containing protein n=1 Tax=Candidatus Harrisonbacteria bacterium CG10_big_fil_rev_8_21_14_0_10_42_17 TaxID=1974584 RepID=A0A2M6WI04_9BACT|nr:MAG: hypothetical protein COU08_02435 [Candidatus Harrisonbacteria bacterium CG10_big_fil_rev_8_21_14_0_10_42_17]